MNKSLYEIVERYGEKARKSMKAYGLAGILMLSSAGLAGCDDNGNNQDSGTDESLLGLIIAGNAHNSKTPEGANSANILGNMLMGRGEAKAGRNVTGNNEGGKKGKVNLKDAQRSLDEARARGEMVNIRNGDR